MRYLPRRFDPHVTMDQAAGARARGTDSAAVSEMLAGGSVLPELDVERVRRWAEHPVPPTVRDQVRLDVDVDARSGQVQTVLDEVDSDPACIFLG